MPLVLPLALPNFMWTALTEALILFSDFLFLQIVYTAIQGIIDATNQQLNEIERECAENNKVMGSKF